MIKDEALGTHGNADWVAINGTVQFIRNENMSYNACTRDFNGRACQKKLQEQGGENEWWVLLLREVACMLRASICESTDCCMNDWIVGCHCPQMRTSVSLGATDLSTVKPSALASAAPCVSHPCLTAKFAGSPCQPGHDRRHCP